MERKFTSDDILRYLYGEMDAAEQDAFLDALVEDEELLDSFETLKGAQEGLLPIEAAPSKSATDRVMNVARRAAAAQRKSKNRFLSTGREKVLNFHHIVSVAMVLFTCLTVGAAVYAYQRASSPTNTWDMSETHTDMIDHALDERLDYARERLEGMMENREETVVPVHHDTYRLVNTDLSSPADQAVVFINIK